MGERRWVEVIHSDPGVPPTADHRWSWVNRGWVSDKLDDAEALDAIALARCDRDHVRLGHGVGCLGDEFQTWVRENRSVVLGVILPDVDPETLPYAIQELQARMNTEGLDVAIDALSTLYAAMAEGETE